MLKLRLLKHDRRVFFSIKILQKIPKIVTTRDEVTVLHQDTVASINIVGDIFRSFIVYYSLFLACADVWIPGNF